MAHPRYNPDRIPNLDPQENSEILKRYVRHLELNRVAPTTIQNKIARVAPFLRHAGIGADEMDHETVEDYFLDRMERLSTSTIDGDVIEFRVFFKWLLGDDPAKELLKNIQKSRKRRELPVEQILTRQDIQAMIACGERQRDRALIAILWDSGARITEITNIDVGDLAFDKYGATVIVNGKTGRRKLRLISSTPDLQEWLEQHPYTTNPRAPLFITSRSYTSKEPRRLAGRTINNLFARLGRQAGIHKPCNPHAIRHARLTDLAREGLSEMELRIVAGWSKSSSMPETYIHLSGVDVEKKILRAEGFLQDEDQERDQAMRPIKCPRCKTLNSPNRWFCKNCTMTLRIEAANEIEDIISAVDEFVLDPTEESASSVLLSAAKRMRQH
ncbi:site-specific recombinase XerD [Methanocalculus sp. AMF5]|uniref:site-specific integrase n=1 Tax=Methanocalculus sp. AMF5 TaxID=1198257 RepID=UPI00209C9600|nr:site-specific integrase [Methanocalculus sp. AMF5]MCP1661869.1 site-specific recombinase XerD [Methanocalculus sp. AMF5]